MSDGKVSARLRAPGNIAQTEGQASAVASRVRAAQKHADSSPQKPAQSIDGSKLERRKKARRKNAADRSFQPDTPDKPGEQWVPRKWPFLILGAVLIFAINFYFSAEKPPNFVYFAFGVALAGMALVSRAYQLSRVRSKRFKYVMAGLVVLLPLLLTGIGVRSWVGAGGINWGVGSAMMICIGGLAAIYLNRQPIMISLALVALWSPVFLFGSTGVSIVTFLVTLVLGLLIGREQLALIGKDEEQRDALERMQTRARDILSDYEQTGQGWFWETDRRAQLTYVSQPVAQLLGVSPERLIGQPLVRLFDMSHSGDEGERTLSFHLSARSSFSELAIRAAIAGEERWWSLSGRPIYDSFNNFVGFRGSGTDLTERKRSQEHASRLALFDSLTGLANRHNMSQILEKILKSRQASNRHCAVFLLDLDRFKHVNDTLGHPAGDALLKQVARRLERAVGKLGQVGRLGGDEFKVIVPNRVEREMLGELARDIIHSLSQPYTIENQRVVIGASVGIAIAPENGTTSEDLIRNSDLALYAAKDGGRGRFHFYSEDLHAEAEARSQLEEDLRDAIAKNQFELFYQPVVAMSTETISGFEALMRWHHPVKGRISPNQFIGIAEDSGQIGQIGEWAIRQVCADLAKWPEEVRVAVNVSPLQFSNPLFPDVLADAIADARITPSRLELEITETVFLSDNENTDAMFAALKKIGVRLALDDFGTGYSSLGYLKKAPFDKIKIDQSFVRGATEEGSRNGAIIASITSLAHALGMDTTAEGVETLDELDLVRMHGCSHVQGFIYERPLSTADANARLAEGLQAVARGPRSARAPRQTMLRKVVLDHQGHLYNGTIRNISTSGAMIEGLWNVPVGTVFKVQISQDQSVNCTTRWCQDDKMGVEFANQLQRDGAGRISAIQSAPARPIDREEMRKAG